MTYRAVRLIIAFALISLSAGWAAAHCEIPCGIYDDQMRIDMMLEHITTIEKSMKQIVALQDAKPANSNQLVRWVVNKENHADELQHIVSQYFMTQRIKPDTEAYAEKLALLHKMLVAAMKCKQTTDQEHVGELRKLVKEFSDVYFGKEK
jgi:nickel superoxide dismutase